MIGTTERQKIKAERVREFFARADRLLDDLLAAREEGDEAHAEMAKDQLRKHTHHDPRKHWEMHA